MNSENKPDTKVHVFYDSIYMKHQTIGKYREKVDSLPGVWEKG